MWALTASNGQRASWPHEDEARRYVARQFPNADRIGVYAWRSHGVDISIKHV